MEQLRGARGGPVAHAEQREEDERVLGAIEKYLRRLNVDMSKVTETQQTTVADYLLAGACLPGCLHVRTHPAD